MATESPSPHFVGYLAPLLQETWKFATPYSVQRLSVLTDIVTELNTRSPFSVLIIDSLAYGLSLSGSDLDFVTFESKYTYQFRLRVAERLRTVRHHQAYATEVEQIREDLAFIQQSPNTLSRSDFESNRQHSLVYLEDFYHCLYTGGILLGEDHYPLIKMIEETAKVSALLHSVTISKQLQHIVTTANYFHREQKNRYLLRLHKTAPYLQLPRVEKRKATQRIQTLIAEVHPVDSPIT
jgi:hypothetical protein